MAEKIDLFRFDQFKTSNIIEMSKTGNIVWIDKYYVDPEFAKRFVILLKSSFVTMEKKNKCKYYRQNISTSDWNNFLSSNKNWRIIQQYEDISQIECDINDASECIIDGFFTPNA